MEDILKQSESEFRDLVIKLNEKPPTTDDEALDYYKSILNWHKQQIKQILQAIVDMEEKAKMEYDPDTVPADFLDPSTVDGWNYKIKDTIDYLNNEIGKLSTE